MISTTTLETSKLLRDAGFRQNFTYFYYRKMWNPTSVGDGEYYPLRTYDEIDEKDAEYAYAAPTTDELLEELPASIERDKCTCTITITKWNRENQWRIAYCGGEWEDEDKVSFQADTLPEALAAMWLWLKKEGLL